MAFVGEKYFLVPFFAGVESSIICITNPLIDKVKVSKFKYYRVVVAVVIF